MEYRNQFTYFGHGVESSEALSASFLPCNVEKKDFTHELSGVPYYTWVDSIYQRSNNDVLLEIETQCRAMLKDVKDTNERAKSLSAYMSIFAFIGTLAKLAFKNNPQYNFHDQHDLRMYLTFVDRFILGYNDTQVLASVINRHGLAEALYRKVRCGLLHGGTLLNGKMPNDERIVIHLSHSINDARSLKDIDKEIIELQNGNVSDVDFVIGATTMYATIDEVIAKMFHGDTNQGIDSGVEDSILKVYMDEPFVVDPNYLKCEMRGVSDER